MELVIKLLNQLKAVWRKFIPQKTAPTKAVKAIDKPESEAAKQFHHIVSLHPASGEKLTPAQYGFDAVCDWLYINGTETNELLIAKYAAFYQCSYSRHLFGVPLKSTSNVVTDGAALTDTITAIEDKIAVNSQNTVYVVVSLCLTNAALIQKLTHKIAPTYQDYVSVKDELIAAAEDIYTLATSTGALDMYVADYLGVAQMINLLCDTYVMQDLSVLRTRERVSSGSIFLANFYQTDELTKLHFHKHKERADALPFLIDDLDVTLRRADNQLHGRDSLLPSTFADIISCLRQDPNSPVHPNSSVKRKSYISDVYHIWLYVDPADDDLLVMLYHGTGYPRLFGISRSSGILLLERRFNNNNSSYWYSSLLTAQANFV